MGAEQAFLTEIGNAYLARAQAPDPRDLLRWKPSGMAWSILREVQGRAAGMQKRESVVDGQRFVWLEGGATDGAPVVLLHGFGASKENWIPLLPFLARRHRLFVPDLPGWGESEFRYEKTYGLDHQVERVAHWLQQQVPAGAHLVGSSMGGASRSPRSVSSRPTMPRISADAKPAVANSWCGTAASTVRARSPENSSGM